MSRSQLNQSLVFLLSSPELIRALIATPALSPLSLPSRDIIAGRTNDHRSDRILTFAVSSIDICIPAMKRTLRTLLSLTKSRRFRFIFLAFFFCSQVVRLSFLLPGSSLSNAIVELPELVNTRHLINGSVYVRQLHLCPAHFQRALELLAFNRTLIVYEAEWRAARQLNILAILVENIHHPMVLLGDLTPYFAQIYSVQCLYRSTASHGQFRHLNTHDYDRTVIISCESKQIDPQQDSSMTLLFTERATEKVVALNISLCWSLDRRATIGHCHKALFNEVPFHLIEQWLNYHRLIGIEQFYIYDRTLKYKSLLQPYVDRGHVVYTPFPLAPQLVERERFNWVDQFVGKMHCLMRVRSAFDWLGTWDIDEYLNFFPDQSQVSPSQCHSNGSCSSMLSTYLSTNFEGYKNIIIYAANFMGRRSLTVGYGSDSAPVIMEQYQHRLSKWNDRVKYLVRPMHTEIINIHYALYITKSRTYESYLPSPARLDADNPRGLLRFNHYPSAQIFRDDLFIAHHSGTAEYFHEPVLWQVHRQLKSYEDARDQLLISRSANRAR